MIGIVWTCIMILSVVCAAFTNRIDILCNAILDGTKQSIDIIIMISGAMIFWSGIMKIAQDSKFTDFISKILSPILKLLFREYSSHKEIMDPICINIVSNLLGLSNAATPSGIKAMRKMKEINLIDTYVMRFLMLNISCIQFSPNFLIITRKNFGASNPYDILPKLWICSFVSLFVGMILIIIFSKKNKRKECITSD